MARIPYGTIKETPGLPIEAEYLSMDPDILLGQGSRVWYLARSMWFDGGKYTISATVDDAATWWVGKRATETRTILSHGGFVERDVYIPRGLQRLDIIIQNIPTGANPTYIAFSIKQDDQVIYNSTPEFWLADYATIPDEALTSIGDARRRLPVFPVLPNWKNGVKERLSWLTDVMQSESGAEQRRAVRQSPRRSFEGSFLRQGAARSRLDNFFVAIGRNEFMLPLWHEAVRMVEGLRTDAVGVSFEGTAPMAWREFRTGDLVFVNNGDPTQYDILSVGLVESQRFSWAEAPKRNWPPGTRIYPMREARIIDRPQMSNVTDNVATVQARFELSEPDWRTPAWGREFDGTGVFMLTPNRIEPIKVTYDRVTYTTDNESSVPQLTDPGGLAQVDLTASFMLRGRGAVAGLRSFLAAARGQGVGFYMMTYTDDVQLVGDIDGVDSWVDVEDSSYSEYMEIQQPVRLMLGVWTYTSEVVLRTIVAAESGRFYLDQPLPPMLKAQVQRVCFVTPARFAQDSVELEHVTAESSVVTTRLVFRQMFNKRLVL